MVNENEVHPKIKLILHAMLCSHEIKLYRSQPSAVLLLLVVAVPIPAGEALHPTSSA